jgi:hypothetical protein
MNIWGFRFILWYICILLVQPQNRFTFLWPLRIANLAFILGVCLHWFYCMEEKRPLLRLGPGTILAFTLLFFSALSQNFAVYQKSTAWNPYLDIIVKNSLLLILIEAMATTVQRVWAVQMTALFSTLWWIKGGLSLSASGATYGSADRLMGAAVSLIENPNGFAYMMCVFLPLYLYAYQQARQKWVKWFFLFCAFAAIYIVFQTGSRTGLVTLIVMGAFLLPYYGRHHFKALAVAVVAISLLFPLSGEKNLERFKTIPQSFASFFGEEQVKTREQNQDEQSAEERRAKNVQTWAVIKAYPFFGVGINPGFNLFDDFWYQYPMAVGQVHCEILMAGRQMGLIGMSMYAGFLSILFFCGRWCRLHSKEWPAVRDMGWTFQVQAVAIIVGGAFSPLPWHAPMMMFVGSASALMGILKREEEARLESLVEI